MKHAGRLPGACTPLHRIHKSKETVDEPLHLSAPGLRVSVLPWCHRPPRPPHSLTSLPHPGTYTSADQSSTYNPAPLLSPGRQSALLAPRRLTAGGAHHTRPPTSERKGD